MESLSRYLRLIMEDQAAGAFNQKRAVESDIDSVEGACIEFFTRVGAPKGITSDQYGKDVAKFLHDNLMEGAGTTIVYSLDESKKYFKIAYDYTPAIDTITEWPDGWTMKRLDGNKRKVHYRGREVFETGSGSGCLTTPFQEIVTCAMFNASAKGENIASLIESMCICLLDDDSAGKQLTAPERKKWIESWTKQVNLLNGCDYIKSMDKPFAIRYNSAKSVSACREAYNRYVQLINNELGSDLETWENDTVSIEFAKVMAAQLAKYGGEKDNIDKSDIYIYDLAKVKDIVTILKDADKEPIAKVSELKNSNLMVGVSLKKVGANGEITESADIAITKVQPDSIYLEAPFQKKKDAMANECCIHFTADKNKTYALTLRSFGTLGMDIKQTSRKEGAGDAVLRKGIALGKSPIAKVKDILFNNLKKDIPTELMGNNWQEYCEAHIKELASRYNKFDKGWNDTKKRTWDCNIATQDAWKAMFSIYNMDEDDLVTNIEKLANWALATVADQCFPFIIVH